MWLEQGGGQGHRDVWVGVEQRGYGHAADGDALALQRHLLRAALLPREDIVHLAILSGFYHLLFKSLTIATEWGHYTPFQRCQGKAGAGLWQEQVRGQG